jgi:hypothetical protein
MARARPRTVLSEHAVHVQDPRLVEIATLAFHDSSDFGERTFVEPRARITGNVTTQVERSGREACVGEHPAPHLSIESAQLNGERARASRAAHRSPWRIQRFEVDRSVEVWTTTKTVDDLLLLVTEIDTIETV